MPLILVSAHPDTDGREHPYPHISTFYCRALSAAGAVPLIASAAPAQDLARAADALVLTGGGDLADEHYTYHVPGEYIKVSGAARDTHEFALLRAFIEAGKPTLGICRGMQLINTALGGTLWEDLALERGNSSHTEGRRHIVNIPPSSWLFPLFGAEITVNSFHHQACRMLGGGLITGAYSEDGICEAFWHESLPLYGVQWHPERMFVPGVRDDAAMSRLFYYFCGEILRRT